MLSGRGLCDALITRPEESYRLLCVVVCDLETSRLRRPWPTLGRSATRKINDFHDSDCGRKIKTMQQKEAIFIIRKNVLVSFDKSRTYN